jgi:16S rRNA processing protein RimM
VHGASLVAKPEGCEDRDQALLLRGCDVLVSRADFPPGDADEYYWTDLIGCEVLTPAGDPLGRVVAVEDHGAHPLLSLQAPNGAARMIPFIGVFVLAVDLAARRITADWPLED